MACERYRDALSELAAGGAPAPAAVEDHLAECADCRAGLAALRRALALVDAGLAELRSAEPSPELAARIRSAVTASGDASARRLGWVLPGLAAAAALVVALLLVMLRGPSPEPGLSAGVVPPPSIEARVPEPAPRSGPDEAAAATPAPRARRQAVAQRSTAERRLPKPAEPDVLVPPGQEETLLRLVALVHREQAAPPGLSSLGQPSADLAEFVPIDIPPLEIVPLDPAEASGTD